ncbi:LamG domain-containing protein [Litoribacillus peritrichatus]|uniref:LamG-like jellyroll fold domain-containing protein n=1 Tax=Litoribacillus peritrichatus TaxID=718191 RepID=A0ABP7MT77_9GAMM
MSRGYAFIKLFTGVIWACFSSVLWAASCIDVFPDSDTSNTTEQLNVPSWSSSTHLTKTNGSDDFAPGDHFFASGQLSGNYDLNSTGVSARLYFTSLTVSGSVQINAGGNPEDLIIVVDGPITISGSPTVNAIMYSTNTISVNGGFTFNGSATSEGSLNLNSGASVSYDSDYITNADFGTLCSNINPVAYWSFNNIVDQTVPDDSGNGHDGTLGNNSSSNNDEPLSQCGAYLEYDGSDDFVNVPDHNDLDISEELTVAVWIRPEKIPSSGLMTIVSKDENFEFHVNSSGQINWWWNNSSGSTREFNSTGTVPVDEWTHVAIVYSKSAGNQTIYLNGVASGSRSFSEDLRNNSDPLQIGNDQFFSGRYFQGDLDEVYVYDQALTQAEVQDLMLVEPDFCGTDDALAYYIFDNETWNGTVGEVSDGSGNGADATAVNGTLNLEATPAIDGTPGTCQYGGFDGQNDYLVTEDSASELQLGGDYSTAVWVQGSAVVDQNQWAGIYTRTNASGSANHWNLQRQDNNDVLVVYHNNASWNTGISLTQVSNGWHHVGITYSGTTITSYLDGVQVSSSTFSTATVTGTGHLNIGADRTQSANFVWNGLIDELFIFDQAISAEDMAALYNQTRPCTFTGSCTSSDYQDTFSTASYNNSDGSSDWSANSWVEINDDDSPSGGRIRITGGELEIRGGGGSQRQIYRSADIRNNVNAQLQFDIRDSNAESNDELSVHIYNGSSWTLLETFDGNVADSTKTYDITAYVSTDTRVRFTEDSNNGNDRFYIDNLSITGDCLAGIDHLEISAASDGSTCNPLAVTIRACEDSAVPCTTLVDDYEESVDLTISTNRGDWSINDGQGILTDPSSDDGAATYQFHTDDNGDAILDLSYIYADQIKITASDATNSLSVVSPTITFSDNAFVLNWDDTGSSDTVAIAGRDHGLTATYVRRDPISGDCGTVASYDGPQTVSVSHTHSGAYSPVPSAPGLTDVVGGNSVTSPDTGFSVEFDQGVADLALTTSDVGQYTISLSDSSGFVKDDAGNPITITGSSAQVTVRPFAFAVDVGDDCSVSSPYPGDRHSGTNTSVSTGPSSTPGFISAGVDLNLSLKAVAYSAGQDANSDGIPDDFSVLHDNVCLPSFGHEVSPIAVSLSISDSLPDTSSGGVQGSLSTTSVTGFSGGLKSQAINYDEVGIIDLDASLTNYLGVSGANASGQLYDLGRFYPSYFNVTHSPSPVLDDATGWMCNFTYQSQNFQFENDLVLTLTAYEAGGDVVQNYGGEGTGEDYFKLTGLDPQDVNNLSVSDNVTGVNPTLAFDQSVSTAVITEAGDYDGDAVITFSGFLFSYLRGANKASGAGDIPFNADLDWILDKGELTDSDGACLSTQLDPATCLDYTIANITGTQIRYGRATVSNNNGSELLNLELPVQIEEWMETAASSGQYSFQVNDEDNCSGTWVAGDVTLSNYQGDLSELPAPGETTVSLGSFNDGEGVIILSPPGAGNDGSVNVTLDVEDWLKYDFYGRGNENPTGTGTFGIFPGRKPIFYLRESYQN